MKFYCDSCQTKYSIADEKVRGKVLKVRCKKCGHVITVREPRAPVGHHGAQGGGQSAHRGAPPPMPPSQPKAIQWHYSINGQSFGPFDEQVLFEKFASGEVGDAAYVWNETFTDWKLGRDVPAFAPALAKAAEIKPPPKTLGINSAMKAIDLPADDADRESPSANEGAASSTARAPEEKKKDRSLDQATRDLKDEARRSRAASSSDRLAKLRQRLKLDEDEPGQIEEGADQEVEIPHGDDPTEQVDLSAAMAKLRAEEDAKETPEETPSSEQAGEDLAHAETLLDSSADEQIMAEPAGARAASEHDGLFSSLNGGAESASPPTGETASEAPSEEPSEDAIPFFPSAPKLGESKDQTERSSSMSRVDEITGSLLIQINEIKKDGRKRAVFGVIGGLAAIVLLSVVVYFAWNQVSSDDGPVEQESRLATDHLGQRPEFHQYSAEELDAIRDRVVLDEAVVVSREAGQAALERDESGSSGSGSTAQRDQGSSVPTIDTSALRYEDRHELTGTRVRDEESREERPRFSRPGMVGGDDDSSPQLSGAGDDPRGDGNDRFRAMAAVQSDTQRGVYGDEFGELNPVELREGLSGAEIAQGIRSITDSVGICRERHIYGGGGSLDANQIEVSITVTPDGRVGSYDIKPASIKDTHFGRCMNTHTRRWGFPRFKGEPVEIQAPFALQ